MKTIGAALHKSNISFAWIGPFMMHAVCPAPASDTPDGRPLHDDFLCPSSSVMCRHFVRYLNRRVPVVRCKPYRNPDDVHDLSKHLPAGITKYVLVSFDGKSPPYLATLDNISPLPERFEAGTSSPAIVMVL